MDTNGSSTLETDKFRSSYLNSLVAEYFKAEARNGLHQKTMKILSVVNPRTYVHRICNSPSTVNPYG